MLRPEVRYARAEDGVTIAYSVVGDGPVTIVFVSPLISQVELAWEEPALEHFWSRFAACARVVMFDRRGAGLSDRSPAGERLSLAALALDIRAVLDARDAGRAVLFGVTLGCPVAVHFAASYPGRVQALVLAGGFAKLTRLGSSTSRPTRRRSASGPTAPRAGGARVRSSAPARPRCGIVPGTATGRRGWSGTPALPVRSRRCAGGRRPSMSARCWPACGCRRW